ncbi:cytochrome P450 2J6-like isoform X1 [Python bivittatus]|uniref:Cytochrome P450 2J6-like isoform X1 n=1 Tax=Python bivittatus TaxID=176946 RepID=A0A9F2RF71_PYTBI|nr:cytochrome P450 2J6-like isoform X1 [Python bivittatus]
MAVFSWLVILSLLFLWFWKSRRPKGFPPGPWHLPLIGNLLQVRMGNPLKDLDQLARKYGSVFSLYVGSKPVVFTHGFPSAKEVLVIKGTEFAGRASFYIMDVISKKKGIFSLPYSEVWKEQRRFSVMLFRNFGVGKNVMEEKILEEATYLIEAFTEKTSLPFDPYEFIDGAVTNILSTILFGKRFEYDSSFLRTLLDLIHQNIKLPAGPWALLYNAVPLVRRLPLPHQKILTNASKIFALLEKELDEHKATLIPGEPRDFTDAYLEEIQKTERKGSSFEEEQLRVLLSDLFMAGTETTSGTLLWGFLYLMAFPEIQEKCQKEIDAVLGNNASLKYEDRVRLPYTNAVIHEIQRITSIVPLGVAHKSIKDVQLFGYQVPKNTMVFVNLHSAHRDKSQWKFPDEFTPSNFLNEKGEFVKPEAFLAFSAGPRVCLGENLARMQLFLFFTSILRNFQLLWPDKSQAPDFTPHFAITQSPSPFKVSLKCRQPSE